MFEQEKYRDMKALPERWEFPSPYKCMECESEYFEVFYRSGTGGKWLWVTCSECGYSASVRKLINLTSVPLEPAVKGLAQWYPTRLMKAIEETGLVGRKFDKVYGHLLNEIEATYLKMQREKRKNE